MFRGRNPRQNKIVNSVSLHIADELRIGSKGFGFWETINNNVAFGSESFVFTL